MFGDDAEKLRRVRVKICGLTNEADARAALAAGADALGFNCFKRSRRFLELARAEWIAELPRSAKRIAILVNASVEEALAIARLPFIDALQFHGAESLKDCALLASRGVRFAKALAVGNEEAIGDPMQFSTDTIVLDSINAGGFGGTGETFPWSIAQRFVEAHPALRIVLAGGLTSDNVAKAVAEVRPFAVDVTSGVELLPGRKDHSRMRDFIAAAHSVQLG